MTQAPTPGPLSAEDELIERGLRTIRTYDAVRFLRDALTATTARLSGYDWNTDPESITKQQGDAFSAADKVFADLDAAVAAHPEIDLPECEACNGTGKIEEPARTEGANQHSACVRSCDECDGCGFAPDESLAPTAPVEASGSELWPVGSWLSAALDDPKVCDAMKSDIRDWFDNGGHLRPQPSGETREAVARLTKDVATVKSFSANIATFYDGPDKRYIGDVATDIETVLALLSARPLALGGQNSAPTDFPPDDVLACDATPARAKAQDEGAAAEPVAWRETFIVEEEDGTAVGIVIDLPDGSQIWTGECSTQLLEDARAREESPEASGQYLIVAAKGKPTRVSAQVATVDDGIALARAIAGHAPAHPSPTPAADAPVAYCSPEHLTRIKREAEARGEACSTVYGYPVGTYRTPLYLAAPAADADRVREAVTIIRDRLRQIWEGDTHLVYSGNPPEPSHDEEGDLAKLANEAVEALNSVFPVPDEIAALKSTAAKEGGEA